MALADRKRAAPDIQAVNRGSVIVGNAAVLASERALRRGALRLLPKLLRKRSLFLFGGFDAGGQRTGVVY